MNVPRWKSTGWLVLIIGIALQSALHAQTLLTLPTTGTAGSGSTAVDLEFRLDGSIIEKGAGITTLSNADLQASSRFIWYPTLGALRAGAGTSTETVSTVGQYSVALGNQNVASGTGSIALGGGAKSLGISSISMGSSTESIGNGSISMGAGAIAAGSASLAIGYFTGTAGVDSIAVGNHSTASGDFSIAMGSVATAYGAVSTAVGYETSSTSYDSFVLGTYNKGLSESGGNPSLTAWLPADPLFEIGNGTGSGANAKDALVVYKDGSAILQGTFSGHAGMRCMPLGDLSMGSFMAGSAP